ncbi:apolipoprotein N-acyltransferase [Sulfuriferula thiophila]|uniref:apolipoprotein N-acyltransferase n=1 Tax=Sulfuriferula thiophila TaxID=1781211 RepID=UPI000F6059F6
MLAAFALGAASVLGFAPFGWFAVPLFTLAGLFWLWHRQPGISAWLAFAFGLGYFGAGVSWIYISLHTYGEMPWLLAATATFLFAAFLALFPAAVGYVYQRSGRVAILAIPAAWMLSEWVRGWIFTGFPWLAVGYSQAPVSPLAGYAPIVGVFGVSLILAWSSAILAWQLRRYGWLVAIIWIAGAGLKQVSWTQPLGAPFSVSLIQGNISQSIKWQPEQVLITLREYLNMVANSHARLTVLPETAIPLFYDQVPKSYFDDLATYARINGGDVLFGIPERHADGSYYNSVMNVGTAVTQFYRKSHLVPFGEYIPLKSVFAPITEVLHIPLSDFSRGALTQTPFSIAGQHVAANVCYEDVFGDEIIRPLPAASILVNVTNDAWFGDSIAPWQHLQISQMRALESGRQMLRATNTGATAIIGINGVVQQVLPLFTRGTLKTTAQGYQGATPFSHWGNNLTLLIAGGMLLSAAWLSRKRALLHKQSKAKLDNPYNSLKYTQKQQ